MPIGDKLKQRRDVRAKQYESEIAAVESRNNDLPKRNLNELQSIRQQIDAARTERQTVKTALDAALAEKQELKTSLQIQLEAATGAEAKKPIREQLDAINAELQTLRNNLDEANATLEALRLDRSEILLQERIAKSETTADDEPEITRRKQSQAAEIQEKRNWLNKHK